MVRVRKPLTDEQRARKNAGDRARRAAAKAVTFEAVVAPVETVATPRRRGRPLGARNKPKVALVLADVTDEVLDYLARVAPLTAARFRA